jgi:hypothetical protein
MPGLKTSNYCEGEALAIVVVSFRKTLREIHGLQYDPIKSRSSAAPVPY